MRTLTFIIGGVLTATGLVAFLVSGAASPTALIPSAIGVLILIAAFIALNDRARRHAIHAALAVALLGIIGTVPNVLQVGALLSGEAERPVAVIASIITFVALVVYLAFGIASFVRARRRRAQLRASA